MLRCEWERRIRRWSLSDLAFRIGEVTPQALGAIERGALKPGDDLLQRMSAALLVGPPAVLLRDVAIILSPEETADLVEGEQRRFAEDIGARR